MSVKTNGAEFKRYYSDPIAWPDGAWHDGAVITVDGKDDEEHGIDLTAVVDGAAISIEGGEICDHPAGDISMETHFKRWRKAQATEAVVIEFDKSKRGEVVAAVKAAGGRVVS